MVLDTAHIYFSLAFFHISLSSLALMTSIASTSTSTTSQKTTPPNREKQHCNQTIYQRTYCISDNFRVRLIFALFLKGCTFAKISRCEYFHTHWEFTHTAKITKNTHPKFNQEYSTLSYILSTSSCVMQSSDSTSTSTLDYYSSQVLP